MTTCTFMLNSWKRCTRAASKDGLCAVHHPDHAKAYQRAIIAKNRGEQAR